MICVSIQNKEYQEILRILETVEMAEIRLDRCALEDEEIEQLFSDSDVPLIATCRLDEEPQAPQLLELAIRSGAKYVDLEMEAPAAVGRRIREACREWGTMLIRSYHNFENTPSLPVLQSLVDRACQFGSDIVKIATTATSEADNAVIAHLYREADSGTLVAFCMGEKGRASRLEALRQGAPFTYACLSEEEATAPGQWPLAELYAALYGDRKPYRAEEITRTINFRIPDKQPAGPMNLIVRSGNATTWISKALSKRNSRNGGNAAQGQDGGDGSAEDDSAMYQSSQRQFRDFLTEFNDMDANNEVVVDLMPSYGDSRPSRRAAARAAGSSSGSMTSAITGLLKGSKYKQKFPMDFIITGESNVVVDVKKR